MDKKKLNNLILQLENYLECWKQFNHFLNLARMKQFSEDDETQFLETKCVITQELEVILASIESGAPEKEEVHSLISKAPSLRYLSELNEGALRGLENNWHKIYIGWQSVLGQLKVHHQDSGSPSFWSALFGRKSR